MLHIVGSAFRAEPSNLLYSIFLYMYIYIVNKSADRTGLRVDLPPFIRSSELFSFPIWSAELLSFSTSPPSPLLGLGSETRGWPRTYLQNFVSDLLHLLDDFSANQKSSTIHLCLKRSKISKIQSDAAKVFDFDLFGSLFWHQFSIRFKTPRKLIFCNTCNAKTSFLQFRACHFGTRSQ